MKDNIKDFTSVRDLVIELGEKLKNIFYIQDKEERTKRVSTLDVAIENEIVSLLRSEFSYAMIISEEQYYDRPLTAAPTWVIDPISGTRCIQKQHGDFAISLAYVVESKVMYALVYDVLNDKVYESMRGGGLFINSTKHVLDAEDKTDHILLNHGSPGVDDGTREEIWKNSLNLNAFVSDKSSILQYCDIALNKYDYVISIAKDVFPYFAASLIIEEAGGVFYVNGQREENITMHDFLFEAAVSTATYTDFNQKLFSPPQPVDTTR